MLLTICILILGVAAVLGLLIGLFRGVTRVKTWAMDLALSAAIVIPVSRVVDFGNVYLDAGVILGTCVFVLLAFTLISTLVKCFLKEHWAPMDKICGGIVLAVKGATIAGIILSLLLCIAELTNISAVYDLCSSVFESSLWTTIKPYLFDYLVIALTLFTIKEGYKTGITGAIWFVIRLVLYIGAIYLAYVLAFNVSAFASAAESLAANLGFLSTMASFTEGFSESLNAVFFAKCLITVGLAIVLLIVARILAYIISKILDNLKESASFSVVDGCFGAVLMFAVFMAILLVLGAFLYTLTDVAFMSTLNEYLCNGGISSVFYSENPLSQLSFFANLNIASYLQ